MKIYNNPNKVQVTFQKPLTLIAGDESRGNSRSSSIHMQKNLMQNNQTNNESYNDKICQSNHPNVIFDSKPERKISKASNDSQKVQNLPKKVSFHYTNGLQGSQQLNYPPNPPSKNKLDLQKENMISKQSNSSTNNIATRIRANSHELGIDASGKMSNSGNSKNTEYRHRSSIQKNQVFREFSSAETKKDDPQYQYQRQRTDSGISSKSSTKIIIETVRQVNPDGSRGAPIEQKHRVETEYLTSLNVNRNVSNSIMTNANYRQNYHFPESLVEAPQHIIVNHNIHTMPLVQNLVYQSPQSHNLQQAPYIDNYNEKFGSIKNQSLMPTNPASIFTNSYQSNHINSGRQGMHNQKFHATNEKNKYSSVYTYPIRFSTDLNTINSQNGRSAKYQQSSSKNIQNGHQQLTAEQHDALKSFPVTSQSKFQCINQEYQYARHGSKDEDQSLNRQTSGESSQVLEKLGSKLICFKESSYRGYGADITKEAKQDIRIMDLENRLNSQRSNKAINQYTNSVKIQDKGLYELQEQTHHHQKYPSTNNYRQGHYNHINNLQTKIKNRQYFDTSQFYSISQRLIDEIFRNETQKAVLKLKSLQPKYDSYRSPLTKRTNYRSKQKNGSRNVSNRVGVNRVVDNALTNQKMFQKSSQQTVKI